MIRTTTGCIYIIYTYISLSTGRTTYYLSDKQLLNMQPAQHGLPRASTSSSR
jgi:hypothetical protein